MTFIGGSVEGREKGEVKREYLSSGYTRRVFLTCQSFAHLRSFSTPPPSLPRPIHLRCRSASHQLTANDAQNRAKKRLCAGRQVCGSQGTSRTYALACPFRSVLTFICHRAPPLLPSLARMQLLSLVCISNCASGFFF